MKPDYLTSPTLWILTIACFVLTLALTPSIMNLARRIGAVDRGGHRRVHNGRPMPLLGGLAIALPFSAVCLLGLMHPSRLFGLIGNHRPGLLALAVGGLGIGVLGALDDALGLRARTKFAGQVCLATLACFAGYTIRAIDLPFYGRLPLGDFVGTALTLLWVVGLTNAYNLIDGIDGLAAGLALIAAVGLAFISLFNGATFPALMCVALCGSLLAFLIYNFHPARIFLGDTGSMFLGYALANITLMGSLKTTGAVIFVAPILVLGLPIMDTLISILRRYLCGQPLFTGDQGHLHHRLLKKGYTQRQAALIFYAIAAVMTGAAAVGWALPAGSALAWLAYACYALAVIAIVRIAGLGPRVLIQMTNCRKRNILLNAFSHYAGMRLSQHRDVPCPSVQPILQFICQELRLSSLELEHENGLRIQAFDNDRELVGAAAGRMKVCIANKQLLYLNYQPESTPDERARNDLETCLANVFERAPIEIFEQALTDTFANPRRQTWEHRPSRMTPVRSTPCSTTL